MIVAPNEARRIAANVAKLPDLLSAEQRRDGNPLVQTPCIGKQGSVKEPVAGPLCDASEPLRLISMVILLRAVSSVAVARAAVSITRAPLVARSAVLRVIMRSAPSR